MKEDRIGQYKSGLFFVSDLLKRRREEVESDGFGREESSRVCVWISRFFLRFFHIFFQQLNFFYNENRCFFGGVE